MIWETIAVAAISGGLFGFTSSLIAPWIGLSVERKKSVHTQRMVLVSDLRSVVDRGIDRNDLKNSADYIRIRHQLSEDTRKLIEAHGHVIYGTYGDTHVEPWIRPLLTDLAKIERGWRLI